MFQKHKTLLFLYLLLVFLLRCLYGTTIFSGEDAFQVYLIGLKWYTTGVFPYWGPDVVYTVSQIPGSLQGILVGGPFFVIPIPEAPFLLLNLLSLIAICYLGWYFKKRIPNTPDWLLLTWLFFAPWTLGYSAHIENPSYLLFASVLFFIAIWETFPMYSERLIPTKWSFFSLGFALFWVMQLHLSWVLMVPFIAGAFVFEYTREKSIKTEFLYFVIGALVSASTLIPFWMEFGMGEYGGTEQNIRLNLENILKLPNIAARVISYSCGETVHFIGSNHEERLAFLKTHLWAAAFVVVFTLLGLLQFVWQTISLFQKRSLPEWPKVKMLFIAGIALVYLAYLFSDQPPKPHAMYLMLPLSLWYSLYCFQHWFRSRIFNIIAIVFVVSGIIFQVALACKNSVKYGLKLKREQVIRAMERKDYTYLGLRRMSLFDESKCIDVWNNSDSTHYYTGFEYPNLRYKPQNITPNEHYRGNFACRMDTIMPFGSNFKTNMALPEPIKIEYKGFIKGDYAGELFIIFEVKSLPNHKVAFWGKVPVTTQQFNAQEWSTIETNMEIPALGSEERELNVYFWLSSTASGELFVDDISLTILP